MSPSQREAMNHFGEIKEGNLLAVSGPPGTGKTTFLQSVVADMYVKSALKRERAPIIVAKHPLIIRRLQILLILLDRFQRLGFLI